VNAVAVIYVNSYLEELRADAHRNRMASLVTKRSMRQRIASAAASLNKTFGSETTEPITPKLNDYPYGG
jgi:hypothetical protein